MTLQKNTWEKLKKKNLPPAKSSVLKKLKRTRGFNVIMQINLLVTQKSAS